MVLAVIATLVGLALLVWAAEIFVDGAVALARALDVSPVVIGAVIVGFGTSLPELLVSGVAAAQDDRALGVGNVVGSNVANLSLVLASAGLITVIVAKGEARRLELPLSLLAAGAFVLVASDGEITRIEGVGLIVALVVALTVILRTSRAADPDLFGPAEELAAESSSVARELWRSVSGLALTAVGAQVAVSGAENVAMELGLSGGFVGFSLVAVGTSLPELVTAVAAVRRGETELVVGNLLGSNIFNSLAVGAAIGLIGPGPVGDDVLTSFGLIIMMVVGLVAGGFLFWGGVGRIRGGILLALWLVALVGLATSDREGEAIGPDRAVVTAVTFE